MHSHPAVCLWLKERLETTWDNITSFQGHKGHSLIGAGYVQDNRSTLTNPKPTNQSGLSELTVRWSQISSFPLGSIIRDFIACFIFFAACKLFITNQFYMRVLKYCRLVDLKCLLFTTIMIFWHLTIIRHHKILAQRIRINIWQDMMMMMINLYPVLGVFVCYTTEMVNKNILMIMIILSGMCLSVRYIVIACGSGAESVLEKVVIIFAAYIEGSQLQQERAIGNGDSRVSCRATIPSPNQTKLCLISQTAAWLSGSHMDSLWTSLLTFPIAFLSVEAAESIKSNLFTGSDVSDNTGLHSCHLLPVFLSLIAAEFLLSWITYFISSFSLHVIVCSSFEDYENSLVLPMLWCHCLLDNLSECHFHVISWCNCWR